MRYPAPEKLEIIRLVEGSHLPIRRTLDKLGIPRTTFYRWYDRYLSGGPEALEDRSPKPSRVWNRIPEPVREKIKDLALKESDLSPRELAVQFTDTEKYFVSEASVYRILKSYDLITSPAYVVLSAADEFRAGLDAIRDADADEINGIIIASKYGERITPGVTSIDNVVWNPATLPAELGYEVEENTIKAKMHKRVTDENGPFYDWGDGVGGGDMGRGGRGRACGGEGGGVCGRKANLKQAPKQAPTRLNQT